MAHNEAISLRHHFADSLDPRGERSRRHEPLDIIGIAICAVISGAESWTAVGAYGHAKHDWLKTLLTLPNGIPSHDTFRRVSARRGGRRRGGLAPPHPVTAWASANRVSLPGPGGGG